MKNLLTYLLMLSGLTVTAQGFEGTIKWKMETEITDPEMKAQMEKSQQMQNDPAMQAQMKMFQEQMNDPKMKEMMESNPAMKAQMEKVMKMAETGDITQMVPKGFTVRIKGLNSLTKVEGGMMEGEILYLNDKKMSYQIDHENKTYTPMPDGMRPDEEVPEYSVTKTGDTKKVLGYTCTKYVVEEKVDKKKVQSFVWATRDINGLDYKNFHQGLNGRETIFLKEIDGVPLRIEMTSKEAKMTMEVVEIKKESVSEAEVSIPAGYKEAKGGF